MPRRSPERETINNLFYTAKNCIELAKLNSLNFPGAGHDDPDAENDFISVDTSGFLKEYGLLGSIFTHVAYNSVSKENNLYLSLLEGQFLGNNNPFKKNTLLNKQSNISIFTHWLNQEILEENQNLWIKEYSLRNGKVNNLARVDALIRVSIHYYFLNGFNSIIKVGTLPYGCPNYSNSNVNESVFLKWNRYEYNVNLLPMESGDYEFIGAYIFKMEKLLKVGKNYLIEN